MASTFKVEIRTDCAICGSALSGRFRTYCSKACRMKALQNRWASYRADWQRKKRGEKSAGKLQCLICGKWYVQVGTHVIQRHKLTAREYREEFMLPVKRGVIPSWYRKLKGDQAIENKTYKNLEKGKRYRYEKNDPRAKAKHYWKGRRGKVGYQYDEVS